MANRYKRTAYKLDPRRQAKLGAVDQLLALVCATPGGVAVSMCGWRGDEPCIEEARVLVLGAALLMAEGWLGSGPGAAEAWLGIVCGAPAGTG